MTTTSPAVTAAGRSDATTPQRGAFRACVGFFLRLADKAGRLRSGRWANAHKDCPCPNCQNADTSARVKPVRDRWWRLAVGRRPPDALHVEFDLPPELRRFITEEGQGKFKAICGAALRRAWRRFGVKDVNGVAYLHPAGPSLQRCMMLAGTKNPAALPREEQAAYDRYHPHVHVLIPICAGTAMAHLAPDTYEKNVLNARRDARRRQQVFRRVLAQEYRAALARFCGMSRTELPFIRAPFVRVYAGEKSVKKFLTFVLREELRGFPGWPTWSRVSTFGPWRKARGGEEGEGSASVSPLVPAAAVAYEALVAAGSFQKLSEEEQALVMAEYEAATRADAVLGFDNGTTAASPRPSANTFGAPAPGGTTGSARARWTFSFNPAGLSTRDPSESLVTHRIRGYVEREDRRVVAALRRIAEKMALATRRDDPRPTAKWALATAAGELGALAKEVQWCASGALSRRRAATYLIAAMKGDIDLLHEPPPFGICALLTFRELAPVFKVLSAVSAASDFAEAA